MKNKCCSTKQFPSACDKPSTLDWLEVWAGWEASVSDLMATMTRWSVPSYWASERGKRELGLSFHVGQILDSIGLGCLHVGKAQVVNQPRYGGL